METKLKISKGVFSIEIARNSFLTFNKWSLKSNRIHDITISITIDQQSLIFGSIFMSTVQSYHFLDLYEERLSGR